MRSRHKTDCLAAALLATLAASAPAAAQIYPERDVRIIVPTAPGGAIDMVARVIGEKLGQKWSKAVVIENKAGAGMRIGADAAAKSPPDGYTLLVAHDGTLAMNAVVYPDLPYNPQRDFVPLAMMTAIPGVLLVNNAVQARSIKELIAFVKSNPGKLNHASGGTATLLWLELFKAMAGIDIANVPFRGGAPAITGVMAGQVEMLFADIATANPGLSSGKLRALGVTSAKRVKTLPEIPTIDEAGVPGYDVATWVGAFAPEATPPAIAGTIEAGIKEALAMPEVRSRLEGLGMDIRSGTAQEMRTVLDRDINQWGKLVREKNIKIGQ
jgi:tripartite-type tricarboxylate transporter receptor subunit TctC